MLAQPILLFSAHMNTRFEIGRTLVTVQGVLVESVGAQTSPGTK